jgi:hypothetical protein
MCASLTVFLYLPAIIIGSTLGLAMLKGVLWIFFGDELSDDFFVAIIILFIIKLFIDKHYKNKNEDEDKKKRLRS